MSISAPHARMAKIIGPDALLALIEEFPNKKLPGKRYVLDIKRQRFLANPSARTFKQWAVELDVSVQSIYNWNKLARNK